jgi:hypothetical protein
MQTTPLSLNDLAAAATTPQHPQHHFAWGQLIGIALLGLSGAEGGPAVWANPAYLAAFVAGISSLFSHSAPPAPPAPPASPASAAAQALPPNDIRATGIRLA